MTETELALRSEISRRRREIETLEAALEVIQGNPPREETLMAHVPKNLEEYYGGLRPQSAGEQMSMTHDPDLGPVKIT